VMGEGAFDKTKLLGDNTVVVIYATAYPE